MSDKNFLSHIEGTLLETFSAHIDVNDDIDMGSKIIDTSTALEESRDVQPPVNEEIDMGSRIIDGAKTPSM